MWNMQGNIVPTACFMRLKNKLEDMVGMAALLPTLQLSVSDGCFYPCPILFKPHGPAQQLGKEYGGYGVC